MYLDRHLKLYVHGRAGKVFSVNYDEHTHMHTYIHVYSVVAY